MSLLYIPGTGTLNRLAMQCLVPRINVKTTCGANKRPDPFSSLFGAESRSKTVAELFPMDEGLVTEGDDYLCFDDEKLFDKKIKPIFEARIEELKQTNMTWSEVDLETKILKSTRKLLRERFLEITRHIHPGKKDYKVILKQLVEAIQTQRVDVLCSREALIEHFFVPVVEKARGKIAQKAGTEYSHEEAEMSDEEGD